MNLTLKELEYIEQLLSFEYEIARKKIELRDGLINKFREAINDEIEDQKQLPWNASTNIN